jgi:hypothetical protein
MSISSNSDWNWPSCERRFECGSRHFRGFDPDICRFREVTIVQELENELPFERPIAPSAKDRAAYRARSRITCQFLSADC